MDVMKKFPSSKIVESVLSLEVSKGHLKWRVSDLARQANVSRPLIYYHFGKTKIAIVSECVRILANEYYGLNEDRITMIREGLLLESLIRTRKMYVKNPALAIFYHKWRMQKSDLQKQFIGIEETYQKKLTRAFPHLSREQISVVHAIFHGLVTAPFLEDSQLKTAVTILEPLLKQA